MRFIGDILHAIFGFTLPEQAAKNVHLVDDLYNVVMALSVIGFFGLMGVMTYFVIRYHRTQNSKSAYIPHNALAETIWTVIPTIIFVGISIWGLFAYFEMENVPKNAYKINVTGKQWLWEFTYKKDNLEMSTADIMYVPVNKPIVLEMTATDVLHSFYVPSFRIKRDTVPGLKTQVNFTATKLGDFKIFCTEFCGTSHSRMRGIVRVVSEDRFERWLNREIKEANVSDPVELGARLFARNCTTCHNADNSVKIGPGLGGIFGKERNFSNADSVVANEEYIRESILAPNEKVVEGFPAKMNSFAGLLTEKEIDYLIEYIKTLK
ncbi:MAG: cytochrome c oxidase subunit II [Bacteriovoracaceae bacterium]|jgi:cytochrome c oxidase subunit 2|nr:cytochrome c oxidase subunit II [Halobacteriovoraceae bacterium]MDP7322172.1 cytochrome c oxidase subunit II [Bacteriovoracaceae bacterium]